MTTHSTVAQGISNLGPGRVNIENQTFNNFGPNTKIQYSLAEQLTFGEIRNRERIIDDAHAGTCEWIFASPQHALWNSNPTAEWHHGLLWIKGNPGAGKSTIMKFMVEQARHEDSRQLILPHFFNARGTDLERSTEGMYRTLLVWLLERLPEKAANELRSKYGTNKLGGDWPVPELVRILKSAVSKFPADEPMVFYIDALDECPEDEVRSMLEVFRSLCKRSWEAGQHLRVCFASRPHPDTNFKDAIFLDLSRQQNHFEDIARYIEDQLRIGDDRSAIQLRDRLRIKAHGNFMWTRLVVHILNKEHDRGSMKDLHSSLEKIPSDLHELYKYTLDRYQEDSPAMLACFRVVLFAMSALTPAELWGAVQRAMNRNNEEIARERVLHSQESLDRYVVRISKGLIEVRFEMCQFIHQSVRDFLLDEGEIQRLYGFTTRKELDGATSELMKRWCEAELRSIQGQLQSIISREARGGWLAESCLQDIPPFANHALRYMIIYAERAQGLGYDQTDFVACLPKSIGPLLISNTRCDNGRSREEDRVSFLYIIEDVLSLLVDFECEKIIAHTQLEPASRARRMGQLFGLDSTPGGSLSPVWHAIRFEKNIGVIAIMELYLSLESRLPEMQEFLEFLCEAWGTWGFVGFRPPGDDNHFLELGLSNPMLSLFFLFVLAPSRSLDPHIGTLTRHIDINRRPRTVDFLQALLLFIDLRLATDAVDLYAQSTSDWIARLQTVWGPGNETYQLCGQILEVSKLRERF